MTLIPETGPGRPAKSEALLSKSPIGRAVDLHPATLSPSPDPAPSIVPREGSQSPSALRRTLHVLRKAMPIVQRLLPMLDGNVAATVVNVLASQSVASAPPVNLAPVEESIAKLRAQNIELHDRLAGQSLALKRLEQRLDEVREAASRNAIEQQKTLVALKKEAEKARIFAFAALALLVFCLLLNLAFLCFYWKGAR